MLSRESLEASSPMGGEHGSPLGLIVASMLALVAWLAFILAYALEWSTRYNLFQNLIVAIASLAITGLLIGLMWVVWGYRRFGRFGDWW